MEFNMNKKIIRKLWETEINTIHKNIDKKHLRITNAVKKIKFDEFLKTYRNWNLHSDDGSPYQFNLYSLKNYGLGKEQLVINYL